MRCSAAAADCGRPAAPARPARPVASIDGRRRRLSDTARIAFVVLLVTGIGLVLGFSFRTRVPLALAAFALVVAFGLVFSIVAAGIGLMVSQPEAAQAAGFVWLFPLTFASGAFVPVDTLPVGLRRFAEINPNRSPSRSTPCAA